MNRIAIATAGAALIVLGTLAAPAHADCASDIKKVELAMKEIPSNESTSQNLDKIKKLLAKSKKLLANKKKKKCKNRIAKAMKITEKISNKLGQAGAAQADCAAKIKRVEVDMKEIPTNTGSVRVKAKIEELLDKSKEYLNNKKVKKCNKLVENAEKIVKTVINANIN